MKAYANHVEGIFGCGVIPVAIPPGQATGMTPQCRYMWWDLLDHRVQGRPPS